MNIINRSPRRDKENSGKGLKKSKFNFRSQLAKGRRGLNLNYDIQVYLVPRRDRSGKIINNKFNNIEASNKNMQVMRRK